MASSEIKVNSCTSPGEEFFSVSVCGAGPLRIVSASKAILIGVQPTRRAIETGDVGLRESTWRRVKCHYDASSRRGGFSVSLTPPRTAERKKFMNHIKYSRIACTTHCSASEETFFRFIHQPTSRTEMCSRPQSDCVADPVWSHSAPTKSERLTSCHVARYLHSIYNTITHTHTHPGPHRRPRWKKNEKYAPSDDFECDMRRAPSSALWC